MRSSLAVSTLADNSARSTVQWAHRASKKEVAQNEKGISKARRELGTWSAQAELGRRPAACGIRRQLDQQPDRGSGSKVVKQS